MILCKNEYKKYLCEKYFYQEQKIYDIDGNEIINSVTIDTNLITSINSYITIPKFIQIYYDEILTKYDINFKIKIMNVLYSKYISKLQNNDYIPSIITISNKQFEKIIHNMFYTCLSLELYFANKNVFFEYTLLKMNETNIFDEIMMYENALHFIIEYNNYFSEQIKRLLYL